MLLCGTLMAGAAQSAPAATLLPASAQRGLDAMRELNVISLGNLTSGHSIEGRTFVGGDVSGGIYGNGSETTPSQGFKASNRPTLTAVGNAQNITLNNGNNGLSGTKVDAGAIARAQFGGNASNIVVNGLPQAPGFAMLQVGNSFNNQNFNPNTQKRVQYGVAATSVQAQDAPFVTKVSSLSTLATDLAAHREQLKLDLQALSDHLKSFDASTKAVVVKEPNKLTFNAAAVTGSYAVFNIAGSELVQNGELFFNLPIRNGSPLTTVINVSGTNITYDINANTGLSPNTPSVIWNFFEATTLRIEKNLYGSVVATKAGLTNSGRLNGSVVSGSLQQNAQIHVGTYNGLDLAVVPEPGSWALMIAGFGLAGATLRRRRSILIST